MAKFICDKCDNPCFLEVTETVWVNSISDDHIINIIPTNCIYKGKAKWRVI